MSSNKQTKGANQTSQTKQSKQSPALRNTETLKTTTSGNRSKKTVKSISVGSISSDGVTNEQSTSLLEQSTSTQPTETTTSQLTQSRVKVDVPAELASQLKFESVLNSLQNRIDGHLSELKTLRTETKRLRCAYESDLNKVRKLKKKRHGNQEPVGFVKKTVIPDELADLIGVPRGVEMSTPQVTKKFYPVLSDRGLFYPEDRRVFRADAEMLKVFSLSPDVNTKTNHKDKDGFNFTTLQKLISNCLKRNATTSTSTSTTVPTVVPVTTAANTESTEKQTKQEEELVLPGKKSKSNKSKTTTTSA